MGKLTQIFFTLKKFFLIIMVLCLHHSNSLAQQFTCEKLNQDIAAWNSIVNKKSETKWANDIKDHGFYQQNADGSFEYVYIMNCTDSVDIATLRNISFNFIGYYFNMNNASRADMEANSPENGLIYQGKLPKVGEYNSILEYNKINTNVKFDIRFKENRIRFSARIESYQVIKIVDNTIVQNYQQYVKTTYPLNQNSDHKKSFANAFINTNSKLMNFAGKYIDYLNRNITSAQPTVGDDW